MKKQLQRSLDRGKSKLSWLDSKFSFSFANYYNPKRTGFGKLLVLNDDIIEPGKGFGSHPHENMEIISIVLNGELAHKDSTGVQETLIPGEIQVMSAGSGIVHSEYNNSKIKKVELLQIWIEPKQKNIPPRHDKKRFNLENNFLLKIVSGEENKNNLYINQDAKLSLGKFDKKKSLLYKPLKNNGVFIFLIDGKIEVEKEKLEYRDSIEISETDSVNINMLENSYFLIIEVPLK